MDAGRVDFSEYLRQLDLEPATADPISILSVTGGTRQTDNLEVFPKIERQADGRFRCRFFLQGSRTAQCVRAANSLTGHALPLLPAQFHPLCQLLALSH